MNLLLSNDDGYLAPGLAHLAESLAAIAEITVVAPDRNRSGASNSLTLQRPLRVSRSHNGFLRVDGTPTDCVHLAVTGLLETEPDMVVAGINAGANLGDDVIYSGTVAAATEGRFLGYPAIAISLASTHCKHFETAAKVALRVVGRLQSVRLPSDTILNINVPDVPYEELKGLVSTRLGHRHKAEPVIKTLDPRGHTIYWVGKAGPEQDAGPGTDFHAVANGFVSVTALTIDLTRYDMRDSLESWLVDC